MLQSKLAFDIANAIYFFILLQEESNSAMNDSNKDNLPSRIKSIRQQLGLSQEELAQKLGVSFTTVNRWENGQTKPSKLARRQIETLCKEFDCQTLVFGRKE